MNPFRPLALRRQPHYERPIRQLLPTEDLSDALSSSLKIPIRIDFGAAGSQPSQQAFISQREIHLSSSSSSSSPSAALGPASSTESIAFKPSKRTREESDSQENTQVLPSLVEPRPIRSLRSSPIPSPPASPSASLHNSSTAVNPSSLPSSTSSPSPLLSEGYYLSPTSTTPSTPPATPLNIMTFNPTHSSNDKTCFNVFCAIDIPETRPVKRRKSYNSSFEL